MMARAFRIFATNNKAIFQKISSVTFLGGSRILYRREGRQHMILTKFPKTYDGGLRALLIPPIF